MKLPRLLAGRSNPVEAALVRVQEFEGKHRKLADRLATAVARVEAAQANRRQALIEADPDVATMEKLNRDCAVATEERAGIEEAARHVAEQLRDAQSTYADLVDTAKRSAVIAECEKRADAIDAATERLADAARTFADARMELVKALATNGVRTGDVLSLDQGLTAEHAVKPILMAALRLAAPGVLASVDHFGTPNENSPLVAARRAQSGRLRDHADDMRQGVFPIEAPGVLHEGKPFVRVVIEDAAVILQQTIRYIGVAGTPVLLREGPCCIPRPVAEAAVEAELGAWPGTKAAADIMRDLERNAATHRTGYKPGSLAIGTTAMPTFKMLDFDLGAWIAAERERIAGQQIGINSETIQ